MHPVKCVALHFLFLVLNEDAVFLTRRQYLIAAGVMVLKLIFIPVLRFACDDLSRGLGAAFKSSHVLHSVLAGRNDSVV